MEEYYPALKEKLSESGLDLGRKEVERIFRTALEKIKDPDNYFYGANSADVFFNPKAVQNFFTTGEIKEYDEATQRGYDWIIANGYAKNMDDLKEREMEISLQVRDLEGFQRALMGI